VASSGRGRARGTRGSRSYTARARAGDGPHGARAGGRRTERPRADQSSDREALVIAEGSVATRVVHILDKLGFGSRAQIAIWAAERGLPQSTSA
jgi:hypothetical protein